MARSLKTLKRRSWDLLERVSGYAKVGIYYGFIPGLLYLGFTTEPKPDIAALLGFFGGSPPPPY
jgi:hypothetical protein